MPHEAAYRGQVARPVPRVRGGRNTPAAGQAAGLKRLAQIHCRDLEGFAILRNRAARDHEPLFCQQLGMDQRGGQEAGVVVRFADEGHPEDLHAKWHLGGLVGDGFLDVVEGDDLAVEVAATFIGKNRQKNPAAAGIGAIETAGQMGDMLLRNAVATLGTWDKPVLIGGVVIVTLAMGALIGLLSLRRPAWRWAGPASLTVIAAAAAAAMRAIGIEWSHIAAGLEKFHNVKGRLQGFTSKNGALIVDDTYNANPDSMKAALDVLCRFDGTKVFVMGAIGELGATSLQLHAEVGTYANEKDLTALLALGADAKAASTASTVGEFFDDVDALIAAVRQYDVAGSTILVKGSRFMQMERVVEALLHTTGK